MLFRSTAQNEQKLAAMRGAVTSTEDEMPDEEQPEGGETEQKKRGRKPGTTEQ